MALTISDDSYEVRLPKGTSGTLKIDKVVDGVATDFIDGEFVYLQVKATIDAPAVITKAVSMFVDGDAYIEFDNTDTSSLDAGDYFYDILWKETDGDLIRLIPTDEADCHLPNFIICAVVTTDV